MLDDQPKEKEATIFPPNLSLRNRVLHTLRQDRTQERQRCGETAKHEYKTQSSECN